MELLQLPDEPTKTIGLASQIPQEARDRLSALLLAGRPVDKDPVRQDCPACGASIDARLVQSGTHRWSRMINHLVTAHAAWWPALDPVAGRLPARPLSTKPTPGPSRIRASEGVHPAYADRVVRAVDSQALLEQDDDLDRVLALALTAKPTSRSAQRREAAMRGQEAPDFSKAQPERKQERRPPLRRDLPKPSRPTGPEPGPPEDMEEGGGRMRRMELYGMTESVAATQISQAYAIRPELAQAIIETALWIGAHPFDLANLISFETNGTFSPKVPGPKSVGAVGLIQFTPATATGLGTSTNELAAMSATQQMPWVRKYLDERRNGRPLDTPQKLAMAVFYPRAMFWPPDQAFPKEVSARNTHVLPDGRRVPIRTPADYLHLMQLKSRLPFSDGTEPIVPEEPGLLDQMMNWAKATFWTGTGELSPHVPAQWDLAPGANGVLVGEDGREWGPGQIPPGTYRFRSAKTGRDSTPITLEAERKYRASSIGRLFMTE
jgi:hypothetical protein